MNTEVGHDKVFGVIKKITLDKVTHTIKNNTNDSKTKYKDYYFELNLYKMTFSYKEKVSDSMFKRSFGYKQVCKYTLHLTSEENNLCQGEYKLGVKVILENKCLLLFFKGMMDLKMWIEGYKKFFEKKTTTLKFLQIKNKNIIKKELENDKNKNKIEYWKYIEKHLLSFSESFICEEFNSTNCNDTKIKKIISDISLIKIPKKRSQSSDKIFTRNKTTSMTKKFKFFNKINSNLIFYKSKLLKKLHNSYLPLHTKTTDSHLFYKLVQNLINNNGLAIRRNSLDLILKGFRDFQKASLENFQILEAANMQNEMNIEWEFYVDDLTRNDYKYSKTNIMSEVMLLEGITKEKKLTYFSNISDFISENNKEFDHNLDLIKLKNKLNVLNENDFELIRPSFSEHFQNLSEKQRDFEFENKEFLIMKNNKTIENTDNRNTIICIDGDKIYTRNMNEANTLRTTKVSLSNFNNRDYNNEILIKMNTKVMYPDDENSFLYQISKDKNNNEIIQEQIQVKTLSVFPNDTDNNISSISEQDLQFKDDKKSVQSNPTYIDSQHFKPELSLTLNLSYEEDNVKEDLESNHGPNMRMMSYVESPHFGNIAIIAQRYNKIDNIDDWKMFINK